MEHFLPHLWTCRLKAYGMRKAGLIRCNHKVHFYYSNFFVHLLKKVNEFIKTHKWNYKVFQKCSNLQLYAVIVWYTNLKFPARNSDTYSLPNLNNPTKWATLAQIHSVEILFWFLVKSFFFFLIVEALNFNFLWIFALFECWNLPSQQNSEP